MIKNKREMYALYEKGEFGNRWFCWSNLKAFLDSGYEGEVNFRYKGEGSGGFVKYKIPASECAREYCELVYNGISYNDIHITVGDFGLDRTFQGEVGIFDGLLHLLGTTVNKVMREALKENSKEFSGIGVKGILRYWMDFESFENIERLFREYPNHVIEFTCYDKPVGVLNLNTVFWEIRYY